MKAEMDSSNRNSVSLRDARLGRVPARGTLQTPKQGMRVIMTFRFQDVLEFGNLFHHLGETTVFVDQQWNAAPDAVADRYTEDPLHVVRSTDIPTIPPRSKT